MFGQFNPESHNEEANVLPVEEQMALDRKQTVEDFFDGYVQGKEKLSGKEYANLFQLAINAGISHKEFESYLKEHAIQLETGNLPDIDPGTIRLS